MAGFNRVGTCHGKYNRVTGEGTGRCCQGRTHGEGPVGLGESWRKVVGRGWRLKNRQWAGDHDCSNVSIRRT